MSKKKSPSKLLIAAGAVVLGLLVLPRRAKATMRTTGPAAPAEEALSRRTGLSVATLRAIAKVESGGGSRTHAPNAGRGSGHSRKPKVIRFEPHAFLYNTRTSDGGGSRAAARRTSPYYGKIPYTPSGRKGYEANSFTESELRWDALMRAFALDRAQAIRATSWGRYQVMGGWLTRNMARDPIAFIQRWVLADLNAAEDLSDEMLVEWIIGNPAALRAAKDRDWRTFATRYNGSPEYAPQFVAAYDEAVRAGAPTVAVV